MCKNSTINRTNFSPDELNILPSEQKAIKLKIEQSRYFLDEQKCLTSEPKVLELKVGQVFFSPDEKKNYHVRTKIY